MISVGQRLASCFQADACDPLTWRMPAATAMATRGRGSGWAGKGPGGRPVRSRPVLACLASSGAGLVPACGSASLPDRVNTTRVFCSLPRVIATYSHCRSSPPVTTAIPVRTVRPCAE